MSADAIAGVQIHIIEQNLDPQSEYEFNNLLDAFNTLQALDYHLFKEPLLLMKSLIGLISDRIDSGYVQTLNTLILKFKEIIQYQMYYEAIFQNMTLDFGNKYYAYQDLLLRDLSISDEVRDFTNYVQTSGASYKTFIKNSLLQHIKEFKKYSAFEAADVFEKALLSI
ncbi:hypothetical protein IC229_31385 [Spirosoma sp. BT702]|uniref:Uncharacterized protein n=1 Tax=Spirosoma profusum TaxID=2771354 RepID=A0A927AVH3_9BACT|nr:hypothetical protein [Spirosoma profusum]MBD2705167.1 hypothetical protein [Spirosoma profusum]